MSSSPKGKVIRRAATVGWAVCDRNKMNEETRQTVALMEGTIISLRTQIEGMYKEKQEMSF